MRVHCITKSKLVQGLAFWTCLQMVIWLNPGEVIILLLLAVLHMFLQIISVMINISIIYFLLGTNLLFKQLKFCPHQIKESYGCYVYNYWHMKHIFSQIVGMFCQHTKHQMLSSKGLLVIVIKMKATYRFQAAAMLSFYILQKQNCLNKLTQFLKISYHTSFQDPILIGANVTLTSQVHTSVVLLFPTVRH
jgi:hypothetical protein